MMETMTGMDSDERLWEARLVADGVPACGWRRMNSTPIVPIILA